MKKRIGGLVSKIGSFFKKITQPIRNTKVWKFLRRKVLRSPFRGYFVASWRELKKVKWPDRKTATKLTLIVITFSLIFTVFTTIIDLGFERLARELFLN